MDPPRVPCYRRFLLKRQIVEQSVIDTFSASMCDSRLSKRFERLAGFDFLDTIGFDPAAYLALHPDLAGLGLDLRDAKAHYLAHGAFERRQVSFSSSLAAVREALEANNLAEEQREVLSRSLALSRVVEINQLSQLPDTLVPGFGYKPVLVCGDSHISIFTRQNYKERNSFLFVPFCCWGGSARGLPKLISRLNYGTMILSVLKDCLGPIRASDAPLLFMFGQNDIEFVYHFKRAADGLNVFDQGHFEAFSKETVARYVQFLQQVRDVVGPNAKIVVCSIAPPSLSDEYVFGNQKAGADLAWAADVENYEALREPLGKLEVPCWRDRTAMHKHYNHHLEASCTNEGYMFLDIFDLSLSEDEIVAKPFIVGQGGKDHHLDFYSFYTDLLSGEACRNLHRILATRDPA